MKSPTSPSAVKILYASFQTGWSLPGFIRYALDGLARTGFPLVLITNRRELDAESTAFLAQRDIEVFFTHNHGFDFGMWRRYLESIPEETRNSWERVLLINDSVVYFRDVFSELLQKAEASPADMVSLTCNDVIAFHLQSYFLYLKPRAIRIFYSHLFGLPEQSTYLEVVKSMEVGFSQKLLQAGLSLEALFPTDMNIHFSYEELIRHGSGFVKRRFLEWRFTLAEMLYFWRNQAVRPLKIDYARLIKREGGMAPDFRVEWLQTLPGPPSLRKMGRWLRWTYGRAYFFTFYRIRRRFKRYWRYATPAVLRADLLALAIICAAGLCVSFIGGAAAGLGGAIAAGAVTILARRTLRRLKNPRIHPLEDLMLISCSFNTPQVTEAMLKSYVKVHARSAPLHCLVMENSTNDETAAFLDSKSIPLIRNPGMAHHTAVNAALAQIKTRYALLVDTDILFKTDIARMFRRFKKSKAAIGGVLQGPRGGFDIVERIVPWFCFVDIQQISENQIRFFIPEKHDYHMEWDEPNRIALRPDRKNYDVASEFLEGVREKNLGVWEMTQAQADRTYIHFEGMSWRPMDKNTYLRKLAKQVEARFIAQCHALALEPVEIKGMFR